jgi:hypothetical protein
MLRIIARIDLNCRYQAIAQACAVFSPLPDWDLSYPWACGSSTWMKVVLLGSIDSKRDVLLSGPMPFVKTRGGGVDDRENRTTSIARVNAGD